MRTSLLILTLLAAAGRLAAADKTGLDDSSSSGEDCTDPATWYADEDDDGYGDAARTQTACLAPEGWTEDDGDCDDADASVHPGSSEIPYDGDGYADVLIGADGGEGEADGSGLADVVLGSSGISGSWLATSADNALLGERTFDEAGAAVADAGDVDADGNHDLLIGAPGAYSDATRQGAAYLVLGSPEFRGGDLYLLSDSYYTLVGIDDWDSLGFALSGAGDVDGDGMADIFVGAYGHSSGSAGGEAYLLLGGHY